MNSPYMGKFKVSQTYKGTAHDGLDLVGIDSKEIHSTINGTVIFAGWENTSNHNQGFGQYVKIKKAGTDEVYYFGHLSVLRVSTGQAVKTTAVIGIEGSTGHSTGSHCHYCMRIGGVRGQHRDISAISKIPNVEYQVFDDGYRSGSSSTTPAKTHTVQKGDTLSAIARKYGTTVRQLQTQNNIKNANIIHIGQVLKIG